MKRSVPVLLAALAGFSNPASADVWGWAEGPSGRTALADASVPADATNVVFAAGEVAPGPLVLANRTLRFTAAAKGTTVVVDGAASGFSLFGASGDWTFRGVSFRGTGVCANTVYDGGAICCSGGRLTLENCSFAGLDSRFTGGAVSAHLMDGDVVVSDCSFAGNAAGPMNGMGGALYASRNGTGSGLLRISGSSFVGNAAQNGGAVATVRVVDDDESPMPVLVSGCTFRGNSVQYAGGAIDGEGDLCVTNTLFAENGAAIQGGAICAGSSDPEWAGSALAILAGTTFRSNSATNAIADSRYWTFGGAIALAGAGFSLSVSGRHVVFDGNRAESSSSSYGGAISAASVTTADVSCAAFLANRAGSAGGAVFSWGEKLGIDTSIFSNNTVSAANGFGGAVSVESGAALLMSNVTVRGSNRTAVDAYRSKATFVNCVVADNGETDISVGGEEGAELVADHTSYGRAEVASGIPVSTNACLSGSDKSIYRGTSLYLDGQGRHLPEAAEGLVQEAYDYDGVKYGSRPDGSSMGAYECPTLMSDPEIEIVGATWYHCRADGLYYPRLEIRFVGGDASRIEGVSLTCGGTDCELPRTCVEQLQAATEGEVFYFGVDPETFVQFDGSPENTGFVPKADRLFGVHDKTRPVELSVAVTATLRIAEVVSVPRTAARQTAAALPKAVPVAAKFTEFKVGERLSGQVESPLDATVVLFGCASLGSGWEKVCELEIGADGAFSTPVPEGLCFFRLEAEVAR